MSKILFMLCLLGVLCKDSGIANQLVLHDNSNLNLLKQATGIVLATNGKIIYDQLNDSLFSAFIRKYSKIFEPVKFSAAFKSFITLQRRYQHFQFYQ